MNLKNKALRSYIIGFGLSILLTLIAFILTIKHIESGHYFIPHDFIIPVLLGLALVQLFVQLVFFLHVLKEDRPRWNLLFFIGTFSMVLLLVLASIVIMNNLKYNHMTSESDTQYILIDEGIKPEATHDESSQEH